MNGEFFEANVYAPQEAMPDYLLLRLPEYLVASKSNTYLARADRSYYQLQQLGEYQHALAEFALAQQADPKVLKELWVNMQASAKSKGDKKFVDTLKGGVLGRVAVFRALEMLGQSPHLSSKKSDSFTAIDLWAYDQPVQVKTLRTGDPRVVEVDDRNISPQDKLYGNLQYFRRQLKRYGEKVHPINGGYLISVPRTLFNQGTGEPRPEFVAFLREHLETPEQAEAAVAK